MNVKILTSKDYPKIKKLEKFNIFRAVDTKDGNIESIEFFNKDGVFRGFGKNTKTAYNKAKKALKRYYS